MYVTVWDRDQQNLKDNFIEYDLVDEFSIDITTPIGAPAVVGDYIGVRRQPKSG